MDLQAESRLLKLIGDQLGREIVRSEHRLREDLGADSLDTVELFMTVEDEFNVDIPDDTADRLKTVEDVINFIDQYRLLQTAPTGRVGR